METFWIVEYVRIPKGWDETETQNDYKRMLPGKEYKCQKGAHRFTLMPQKNNTSIQLRNDTRKAIFIRSKSHSHTSGSRIRRPGDKTLVVLKQQPATIDLVKRHKSPTQPRPRILSTLSLFSDSFPAETGQNYLFYTGQGTCSPYGMTITEIHDKWKSDYTVLEHEHGYIQWLFPLFVRSSYNSSAPALTRGEAILLRRNRVAANNIVKSYRMMLDFFGLRLLNTKTGKLDYAEDRKFVRKRMDNLSKHGHNYLRITRILTSLGHLGFTRYKRPLLEMLERVVKDYVPRAKDSLEGFWRETVMYESENYYQSTKELPLDREPSVFFFS